MEDRANAQASAEMPRYRSHKTVWALKIATVVSCGTDTTTDENPIVELHFEDARFAPKKVILRNKPEPQDGWYYVQYEDGYWSFSPAAQFEAGNTLESKLTEASDKLAVQGIGWAVKQMQNGAKVRRAGWNGKGMWIVLMPSLYLPPYNTGNELRKVNDRTAKWIGEDKPLDCQPYIAMWNAQGKWQPGWTAAQSDLLATDWEIAE